MWKTTRLFDFFGKYQKGRPRIEYALTLDKVFSTWIRDRIADFGFIDDQDFLTILLKTPNGGRPITEYFITLDMAKELAMVGGTVRIEYFEKAIDKFKSILENA